MKKHICNYFQIKILQNNLIIQENICILSEDDIQTSIHTPTKTLLYVIHLPEIEEEVNNKTEYSSYYSNLDNMMVCESEESYGSFSNAVIYNDYEDFASKVVHYINFL